MIRIMQTRAWSISEREAIEKTIAKLLGLVTSASFKGKRLLDGNIYIRN